MSCYIVDSPTLARVATAMVSYHPKYNGKYRLDVAEKLFAMNKRAFNARYEGRYKEDLMTWDQEHLHVIAALAELESRYPLTPDRKTNARWFSEQERRELLTALQSLRCFEYQCSEGKVPDTRLFKDVEETEGRIAANFLYYTGTYEGLPWA
jgi:hypothetical protein